MSAIDVDEILEHQLNANLFSMPYDVYSELFDSIAALGDENAKLRKENAELRVDVDLMNCQLRARAEERNDLQVENAKLRKLVRISIEYCNSGTCDECPIQDDDGGCPYAEMALKLGVEVAE